jgi:hypothetical protein
MLISELTVAGQSPAQAAPKYMVRRASPAGGRCHSRTLRGRGTKFPGRGRAVDVTGSTRLPAPRHGSYSATRPRRPAYCRAVHGLQGLQEECRLRVPLVPSLSGRMSRPGRAGDLDSIRVRACLRTRGSGMNYRSVAFASRRVAFPRTECKRGGARELAGGLDLGAMPATATSARPTDAYKVAVAGMVAPLESVRSARSIV